MNKYITSKLFLLSILLFAVQCLSLGQQTYIDSLERKLKSADKEDTAKVLALSDLATYYGFIQFDSCLFYARQTDILSQKINYARGRILSYRNIFSALNCQGNYPQALETALNLQKIIEQYKKDDLADLVIPSYFLGVVYREMADYPDASLQLNQAIRYQEKSGNPMPEVFYVYSQLAILYRLQNKLDSSLVFAQKGFELGMHANQFRKFFALAIGSLGNVYEALHNYTMAEQYYRQGIKQSLLVNNVYFLARNYNNLAGLFEKIGEMDSSIHYAGISLAICTNHNFVEFAFDASKILTDDYTGKSADSTLKYMKVMVAAKDSVFSQAKGQQFQQYAFNEVQRLQKINADKERYQNQLKVYFLLGMLSTFSLLVFILYRNNRQKQKAKNKIETAYSELKATQSQLIHAEKMASLGELTAGIAHEIQNPLNFVNNFAEINNDLITEMREAIAKQNFEEVDQIAKDVQENQIKINHHGKRADAIVKGMLQHSRSSIGANEPTDINSLADEYLRLAYHGLRAKDNSFNASMKTDFDVTIGKINIIPQDIGRVLLNLYNNAFYAVAEKRKLADLRYDPAIFVNTKKVGNYVFISVRDNGIGIPQKVVAKIFQPFFTTKPSGQGTGLGLSLSYDILKAHGGEIKVNTIENEGSEFIIQLLVK